jgi:hypothetical protein
MIDRVAMPGLVGEESSLGGPALSAGGREGAREGDMWRTAADGWGAGEQDEMVFGHERLIGKVACDEAEGMGKWRM